MKGSEIKPGVVYAIRPPMGGPERRQRGEAISVENGKMTYKVVWAHPKVGLMPGCVESVPVSFVHPLSTEEASEGAKPAPAPKSPAPAVVASALASAAAASATPVQMALAGVDKVVSTALAGGEKASALLLRLSMFLNSENDSETIDGVVFTIPMARSAAKLLRERGVKFPEGTGPASAPPAPATPEAEKAEDAKKAAPEAAKSEGFSSGPVTREDVKNLATSIDGSPTWKGILFAIEAREDAGQRPPTTEEICDAIPRDGTTPLPTLRKNVNNALVHKKMAPLVRRREDGTHVLTIEGKAVCGAIRRAKRAWEVASALSEEAQGVLLAAVAEKVPSAHNIAASLPGKPLALVIDTLGSAAFKSLVFLRHDGTYEIKEDGLATAESVRQIREAKDLMAIRMDPVRSSLRLLKKREDEARTTLVYKSSLLRERLERMEASVAKGHTPNSLGEIQSSGIEIDALCGRIYELSRAREDLSATYDTIKATKQMGNFSPVEVGKDQFSIKNDLTGEVYPARFPSRSECVSAITEMVMARASEVRGKLSADHDIKADTTEDGRIVISAADLAKLLAGK